MSPIPRVAPSSAAAAAMSLANGADLDEILVIKEPVDLHVPIKCEPEDYEDDGGLNGGHDQNQEENNTDTSGQDVSGSPNGHDGDDEAEGANEGEVEQG